MALLLVALSVLWGGSFVLTEVALADLPPMTVVLGRVGLAALALNVVVVLGGRRLPTSPRVWGALLVMGALNNLIPFNLIVWGQTRIDGGLASILNATTPLFAVLLAHVLTRDERLTPRRLAGVLLGLALLSTALAYVIYFRILAAAGATNLLLVTFLIPVSALLLGAAFLGERPGWTAIAGMALISAGLAAIDGRLTVWLPRAAAPDGRTRRRPDAADRGA